MRSEGRGYFRNLNSYYRQEVNYPRHKEDYRRDRENFGRSNRDGHYGSSKFGDRNRDYGIFNRNRCTDYHRNVNVYNYSRDRRYSDSRFSGNDSYFDHYRHVNSHTYVRNNRHNYKNRRWTGNVNNVRYLGYRRSRDFRNNDRYDNRRSSGRIDRFLNSKRDENFIDYQKTRESFRRCDKPKKHDDNCNSRGGPVILHNVELVNLSDKCTATDLMRIAKASVGMPDLINAFGDGKGIIGFYDNKKFKEMRSFLKSVKTIPMENGKFTTLTVI